MTSAQYFRVILAYPIFINSVSVQNSSKFLFVYTAAKMFSSWISDYQYLLEIDNLSKILFVNNRLAYNIMSVNIPSDPICVNMFVVYFSALSIFLVSLDVYILTFLCWYICCIFRWCLANTFCVRFSPIFRWCPSPRTSLLLLWCYLTQSDGRLPEVQIIIRL